MSLWWFGWSGTVFLSSTRVIFAAAFDRMLPEGVSYIEPRTRTPIIALMLMVIPALIISFLYAYNIFNFVTLVLDATLVIVVSFWGTTLAAMILPWRSKEVYEGSPIAKFKMPSWLSYLMMLVFVVGGIYLIYTSSKYAFTVMTNKVGLDSLTVAMVLVVALLTVVNAVVIIWLIYYIGKHILAGDKMPLITLAGIVFFLFLDWLLVEWFWDPHLLPLLMDLTNPSPSIGWNNHERMSLLERGPADVIIALALVHHLAIANNVPLDWLASFLKQLGQWLIVEFIPKTDSQVQRLLMSRADIFPNYTAESFENSFSTCYKLRKEPIQDSERCLYLMERL